MADRWLPQFSPRLVDSFPDLVRSAGDGQRLASTLVQLLVQCHSIECGAVRVRDCVFGDRSWPSPSLGFMRKIATLGE